MLVDFKRILTVELSTMDIFISPSCKKRSWVGVNKSIQARHLDGHEPKGMHFKIKLGNEVRMDVSKPLLQVMDTSIQRRVGPRLSSNHANACVTYVVSQNRCLKKPSK